MCDDGQRKELLAGGLVPGSDIEWVNEPVSGISTDIYIDLQFDLSPTGFEQLKLISSPVFIVNAVENTLEQLPENFVRINGWNSFLKNEMREAAALEKYKAVTEKTFSFFNKKMEWITDQAGFITPRVISMIINEAYYALEEKLSTKDEIDIAMKLGTNYPYGPFEWSEKIGADKIFRLLKKLSAVNNRYDPAPLLEMEAKLNRNL